MNGVLIWLLVVVTTGEVADRKPVLIAKFPDRQQCERVREDMPKGGYVSRCIQAEVILN